MFVGSQMAFASVYLAATMGRLTPGRAAEELHKLGSNGDVVAVATFLSTPACLLAILIGVTAIGDYAIFGSIAISIAAVGIVGAGGAILRSRPD